MDGIAEKLEEIEKTARAIVENAEDQKHLQEKEMQEKRDLFDLELEKETQDRINAIRSELEENMDELMEQQGEHNNSEIQFLKQDFEKKHTVYAKEIFDRVIKV